MGVIVTSFDYAAWALRYPEFADVPQVTVEAYWIEAGIYLDNAGASPVPTVALQALLLNMLTAHIAQLYRTVANGSAVTLQNGLVGRIASASEGSVSVSAGMDGASKSSPSADWFLQTTYGASFWQATAAFRTARYRPAPLAGYPLGSLLRGRWGGRF